MHFSPFFFSVELLFINLRYKKCAQSFSGTITLFSWFYYVWARANRRRAFLLNENEEYIKSLIFERILIYSENGRSARKICWRSRTRFFQKTAAKRCKSRCARLSQEIHKASARPRTFKWFEFSGPLCCIREWPCSIKLFSISSFEKTPIIEHILIS